MYYAVVIPEEEKSFVFSSIDKAQELSLSIRTAIILAFEPSGSLDVLGKATDGVVSLKIRGNKSYIPHYTLTTTKPIAVNLWQEWAGKKRVIG